MDNYLVKKGSNLKVQEVQLFKAGFLGLVDNLLSGLSSRSQEIVKKRFGLLSEKSETLEKIGRHYGITRERVRQIIAEAMKNILAKSESESFLKAEEKIIFTIESNGGIIKESDIVEKFNPDGSREANAIRFFAYCSKNLVEAEEKKRVEKSWAISINILKDVKKVIAEAENFLEEKKKLLTDDGILDILASSNPHLSQNQVLNFLKVSSRVKKNRFGKWGLVGWMEINPKGTKEKVYLVLKEHGEPLHFTRIAQLIDEYQLGKRKAHPQTVHNELIKDDRFVLIGRGIYALKEKGYFSGTIREVLRTILGKNSKPMAKEDILAEVMKIRKVKEATVMINLNNSKIFQKQNGLYSLKK